MRMALLFLIGAAIFGAPSAAAAAMCSTYKAAKLASKTSFADSNPGTLGIAYSRGRYLTFPTLGCYDIQEVEYFRNLLFYLNYKKTEISYISVAVTKVYPYPMRDVPPVSLDLYRNGGTDSGAWLRAVENEDEIISNTNIAGSEIAVLPRSYDTEKNNKPPFDMKHINNYSSFDFKKMPELVSKWHALLSDAPVILDPNSIYKIYSNTRNNIGEVVAHMDKLNNPEGITIKTKLYLIKFSTESGLITNREVLNITSNDCVYIKYQVDGYVPVPRDPETNSDILTLRVKDGANC